MNIFVLDCPSKNCNPMFINNLCLDYIFTSYYMFNKNTIFLMIITRMCRLLFAKQDSPMVYFLHVSVLSRSRMLRQLKINIVKTTWHLLYI